MSEPLEPDLDDVWYDAITSLVATRSGLVFTPNRRREAESAITRSMRQAGTRSGAAYLALLHSDGGSLDALLDAVTVGETHFMRDPGQIDLIRRQLLPVLARRAGRAPARVWSAGCATGEEAYSLAILLEEEGLGQGALVLGTDLSETALAKARAASYSDWSMRGVSDRFLGDYFTHEGGRRVLAERLRNNVRFERLNLAGDQPYAETGAHGMDLILCRNVLIYFSRETAQRILRRLFDCLAEGGALLTAGADVLFGDHAPFEVELTSAGLVYRRPLTLPPRAAASVVLPARLPPVQPPSPPAAVGPRAAFDRVLALCNADGALEADRSAQAALRLHPLDAPLHYLRGALLVSLDQHEEAEREARRAIYLDARLAVAHFLLGTILRKRDALPGALRAFRNVRALSAERPADEEVPAWAGERMGALHSAAGAEIERLEVAVV